MRIMARYSDFQFLLCTEPGICRVVWVVARCTGVGLQ